MNSSSNYKLYNVTTGSPVPCANAAISQGQKRVIMIGGIQDLCGRSVAQGTWMALSRALESVFPKNTSLYSVGKADRPEWLEDDWTLKSFIGGAKNPPAEALAETLFHLPPKQPPLADTAGYLKQLERLADNTVFVTFSTGSLLLQHMRDYMVERLRPHFSEKELSPILAKIGALNIAPIYPIGKSPESLDFTQVSVLNMRDPYGAGTPDIAQHKDEIIDRGNALCEAGNKDKQCYFQAYEEKLLQLLRNTKGNYNPNLKQADHDVLGTIAVNNRNLIIYGKADPDRYPSRIDHQVNQGEHTPARKEQDNPLIKEHEPALYLNQYSSTRPRGADKYKITQTFQRFAGAHIIPQVVTALLGHQPLWQLAEGVAQEDKRIHAQEILANQKEIDAAELLRLRGKKPGDITL